MGFFRALFAVIAATVLAFLLGMAFDYFRMAMDLRLEGLLMVFPLVAGGAGFIAAIFTLLLTRNRPVTRVAGPGATTQAVPRKRGEPEEIIPGMPVYDDRQVRQRALEGKSVKPEEK